MKKILVFLPIAAVSVLFLYVCSYATSPLYAMYDSYDASIFMLIGKGISRGMKLYADLFDHKGPLLFFINAIGYMIIPDKAGVFIVECAFLIFTNIMIYKTARLFLKPFASFLCVIFTLGILFSTLGGGNLSEEYCLPFCITSLYFALKYLSGRKSPKENHPYIYAYIYGLCFGICAFIRINNGLYICAVVLSLTVSLIRSKQYSKLFGNALFLILGVLSVAAPIIIYFYAQGTLYDMLYATFIYNFKYAGNGIEKDVYNYLTYALRIMPGVLFLVLSFAMRPITDRDITTLIRLTVIITSAALVLGFGYPHYYTTLIPNSVLFFIITINWTKYLKSPLFNNVLIIALIFSFTAYWQLDFEFSSVIRSHYNERSFSQGNYDAQQLAENIPSAERGEVFGYNTSAQWFLATNIMPCYKYFTLQEWWAKSDFSIIEKVNSYIILTPPKWIVVSDLYTISNLKLQSLIKEEYTFVDGYENIELYRYNN